MLYLCYVKCANTGTSDVIFGYNGRDGVVTDKNGLIYMRARYYSPEMRRFVNADIIPGRIANAVTLNRYAYANANPISLVDPLGLSSDDEFDYANLFPKYEDIKRAREEPLSPEALAIWKRGKEIEAKKQAASGRDYEAEAIEKINKSVDTVDDNISDDFLEKNVPKTYSLPKEFEDFFGAELRSDKKSTHDMADDALSGVGYAWEIGSPMLESAMVKSLYNAPRPNNIGVGTYSKMLKADEAFIRKGVKYTGYGLTALSTIISTGIGIEQNIQNGESAWETGTDAAIDIGGGIVAIGTTIAWDLTSAAVIGKLGAAIGTTIAPGVGTAIGIGLGIGVGLLYDNFIDPMLDNML